MHVVRHHTPQELSGLIRRCRDRRLRQRMTWVREAMLEATAPEIAELHGGSRRSIQEWVRRYNQGGLDGLRDRPGRGDKPTLSPGQQQRLAERLDAGPVAGDAFSVLSGPVVKQLLEREMGVVMPLRTVQGTLHRMGYRYLVPRPRHVKADPAAQEAFKKDRRDAWGDCPETPAEASGGVL